jgi:hypothetical protein
MATYTNTWKNKAWLGWFLVQIPIIFCTSRTLSTEAS